MKPLLTDVEWPLVKMKRGTDEKTLMVEAIVFAINNRPNTELGLRMQGIKFSEQGIIVNDQLETSVRS